MIILLEEILLNYNTTNIKNEIKNKYKYMLNNILQQNNNILQQNNILKYQTINTSLSYNKLLQENNILKYNLNINHELIKSKLDDNDKYNKTLEDEFNKSIEFNKNILKLLS